MITQRQVDELHVGDIVELRDDVWPDGSVVRGPVKLGGYGYEVGPLLVTTGTDSMHLTVVSRAPRPLYVNHPRTEPVPKDVVLAPDGNGEMVPWICIQTMSGTAPPHFIRPTEHGMSHALPKGDAHSRMCQPWRLLVDGETGQVVP